MLWLKALHIIFMIAWFAGLFYLPRLFVYHAGATDNIGNERFKTMEYKLYYFIMHPAMLGTLVFGLWLWLGYKEAYHGGWVHAKLALVALLVAYHVYCGVILKGFKKDKNTKSAKFFRIFNEIPTLLLVAIVVLVVVKPF